MGAPRPFGAHLTKDHSIYFQVSVMPGKTTTCRATPISYQVIPQVPLTGCDDNNVSWYYNNAAGGAVLGIVYHATPHLNITGTHYICGEEIANGNMRGVAGHFQTYNGPSNFVITQLWEQIV